MRAIDVHSHFVPHDLPHIDPDVPWLRVTSEREAMIMLRDQEFRRITSECWAADARLRDMDADDVDIQVVSPTPVFFSYNTLSGQAERISRIVNDFGLEMCGAAPDRLFPFCQVPLQDTDGACRELERAVAAGHRGVEIGNHVGDRDLDDAGIVTFLQHAAALDVPVFVHPWDMPAGRRVDRWMSRYIAGMPAETHLSIIAMILGGVFDQVPDSLRICFAHGGGSFAFWLGRLENAWHQQPDIIGTSSMPPSAYTHRLSVDSTVISEAALRTVVDTLGAARVMVGSDYPYALGERPAGAVVRQAGFLDEDTRGRLLRDNASVFLGTRAEAT